MVSTFSSPFQRKVAIDSDLVCRFVPRTGFELSSLRSHLITGLLIMGSLRARMHFNHREVNVSIQTRCVLGTTNQTVHLPGKINWDGGRR